MTVDEIKEMYKSLTNDDLWEYRKRIGYDHVDELYIYSEWKPYKLGEAIHEDFEYRKVEKWYVVKETNQTFTICPYEKAKQYNPIHFEGSKEECEEWIEKHGKKTWLEERLEKVNARRGTRLECKDIVTEICKKILEETNKMSYKTRIHYVEKIIKDLGVEV